MLSLGLRPGCSQPSVDLLLRMNKIFGAVSGSKLTLIAISENEFELMTPVIAIRHRLVGLQARSIARILRARSASPVLAEALRG